MILVNQQNILDDEPWQSTATSPLDGTKIKSTSIEFDTKNSVTHQRGVQRIQAYSQLCTLSHSTYSNIIIISIKFNENIEYIGFYTKASIVMLAIVWKQVPWYETS